MFIISRMNVVVRDGRDQLRGEHGTGDQRWFTLTQRIFSSLITESHNQDMM